MARKAIAKGRNGKGQPLALIDNGNGTWSVLVQQAHYCRHAPGGIAHNWCVALDRKSESEARALFNRRNKAVPAC